MAISERDRRALIVLVVASAAIGIFAYGPDLAKTYLGGNEALAGQDARFRSIYGKMKYYQTWAREIEHLQEKLHVKATYESEERQKDAFVKAIEDLGLRTKVAISQVRPLPLRASAAGGVKKRAYLLTCTASFPNFISFIKGLEELTIPTLVDSINLTKRATEGRTTILGATLQVQTYIFPEKDES
ncbi:MAG: hypothetical protein BWZ10_00310 [candidate division BRC1 bacterium ADurb.BinA364]|nr:MAG: hypothetical protein BWZ10_00310 [candidate division BRC1 bacterium ADurb.BinA364]